ncbi:hypothetical protein, partial [Mariniflexile fucanivorans]
MMKNFTFLKHILSQINILVNLSEKLLSFFKLIAKKIYDLQLYVAFGFLLKFRKATYQLMLCLILLSTATAFSQLAVPFSPRLPGGSIKVKGDIVLIGNSIIKGKGLSDPYNGTGNNNSYEGEYINVASGGDASIFSSSTANLALNTSCKSILYAGLYWASVYPNAVGTNSGQNFVGTARLNDWNQVKFKLPTGGFVDLVADTNTDPVGEEDDIIFDGYDYSNINNSFKDSPIICYKNVTNLLQSLTDADGTYTVANLRATTGRRNGGCAGGWTLVVIYESPTLPSKFISVFDGYAGVQGSTSIDIPVSGFQTLPAPSPVVARIGVSALEGDLGLSGDTFRFKASTSAAFTTISDALSPANNFFNSRITNNGSYITARNPSSQNTLGFDIKNVIIPNPLNGVIPNGASAGDLKLTTSGDGYGAFVTSFAVDIIEPKILLTKVVEDALGNDVGGADVTLGDELNYVIGFQNIGNDDATKFTIRDILPINVIFNYPADLGVLPSGISVQNYNALTREIIFEIDDSVVEINDPVLEIRFKVSVVPSCNMLSDACSNSIDNQAYATYEGVFNPNFTISDDPSINSNSGCILTPKATNFLVGVDDCLFTGTEVLCGATVELTAASGYNTYSWSTSPTGTPVIGTNQSITVSNVGTYYVHNTADAPCLSINQEITVIPFGGIITNPVIPFADEVVICPNDGKQLPNIFLCGANASRDIQTGVSDGSTIIWEKLNEASCAAVYSTDCANENTSCTWTQVGTGPNYTVNTSGQFRITLNYAGGCFNRYYFNSYQNLLNPTVSTQDIICTTPGQITVGGVPSGYEYSIDDINYQPSNILDVSSPNIYTVYIKQVGVTTNPCVFSVPDIQIRQRNFTVSTVVTQPYCNGGKGSVKLAANDVRAQYSYAIYQGATLVNSVGPIDDSDYTFLNLNPGTYTATISTEDGCTETVNFDIINPPLLTATSAITKPLTCTDGEITVYPTGGTAPYFYFVNSTTEFQDVPEIVITSAGTYNITVVDSKNCSTNTTITIDDNPAPIYTINQNNILCYNDNSGSIEFSVTNANGYTLEYSIDNGVTYVSNPVFSNLTIGDYEAILKYSIGVSECFTIAQSITITQPDAALTASSGVSELAGCGPSDEGRVRITNPQGGTPPYEYSFDNQATWVTTNESYVLPGTYTLYIKDANGCVYAMSSITLDPEPVAPTIDVSDPDFNCDGTAGATVTVTNPGSSSFTYNYLLDGVPNTNTADPKTFLDVPDGSHTITVEYVLSSVPTYSNLLYETFGYGDDTTSPGINPTYYCFERQVVATQCKGNPAINDGDYSVTARVVHPFSAWVQPGDHTPATVPATPKGRCLVVNIGATIPKTETLYEKQINDIIPNQPINVEFFAMNLLKTGNTQYDPDLVVALVNSSGIEISSFSTGNIPKTQLWESYPKTPMTLDPGSNTSLKFIVRSNVQQVSGNDVAIDDISVYQLPKSCVTQVEFPFIVDSGKAFTSSSTGSTNATCNGSADGTITISAQNFDIATGFQYSIDNGITWNTQMTSPYTITGLAAGNYNVMVRYETCSFTLPQTISEPTPLQVSVSGTPVTCLAGSTVTATATGGTAAYSYQLLDTATLNLVNVFPSNGILTNVAPGDYTVRVTDANGCTATDIINLVDSVPPTASIATTSDYCYDSTNGATLEVTASGGVAPYEYNINGGPFGSSHIFANLVPGTYTIIVRDAYGCTVTLPAETIAPQLTANTTLTKELDCSASPDAVITGTITGGYAPFTYEVSINGSVYTSLGSTGTPFIYSAGTAGTYQFRITDANSCQSLSNIITVDSITNPTVTATTTNVTCNGASDGTAQLVGLGGSGGYTFSNDNITFGTTSLFTGLSNGSHTFYVKDSKACTSSITINITQPTPLATTANASTFSCSATNTKQSALITIDVPTTGTAPYQYSFNNGASFSSSNTLTVNDNGSDQTFNYVVKDANGCLTTAQTITLIALAPPTDLVFDSAAVTCAATTTTVNITNTIGGVGTLQYETISPSPIIRGKQASNSFANLTPGTYVFRVTDANGCYYSESYTIAPVIPIAITGTKLSDVLCRGDNSGSGTYSVSGNATVGNYTFVLTAGSLGTGTLTPSGNVLTLSNVVAGTYTVEVTDSATQCTANATISITEPTNALTLSETSNINANCFNRAQVTVTASGGTPNYTYAFVQDGASPTGLYASSSSATLDPITNTDWDVWVLDNQGCTTKLDIVVSSDGTPSIDAVPSQCYTGTPIAITLSGTTVGTPTYSIGGAYQTSPNFSINAPGVYNVSIKDGNGCIASRTFELKPELLLDANMTQDLTCIASASIALTPNGGTGTYSTYEVDYNGGGYSTISGSPYTATLDGNYRFRVIDSQGCQAESSIVIVNPVIPITASNSKVDPTCNGDSDGSITLTALTGDAPFRYSIDGGSTFVTSNVFGGLVAGSYNYLVRDNKECDISGTVVLNDPAPIVPNIITNGIQCSPNTPGSFDINIASGGTAPYVYTLYDNSFTQIDTYTEIASASTPVWNFGGLNFGDYYITIVDANGCEYRSNKLRIEPIPYLNLTSAIASASCLTGVDVELNVTGGIPDYTYLIYGQPATSVTTSATSYTFSGLDQGTTYVFEVIDINGCPSYLEITTPLISPIIIDPLVATNVSCFGANNGEITFTVDQYDLSTTDLYYEVRDNLTNTAVIPAINGHLTGFNPGPANGTITGLPAGNYTLFVREFDGTTLCSTTLQFQITQPIQPLASAITAEINANCNSGAQLTLTTTGGTGPYKYAIGAVGFVPVASDFGTSNVLNLDYNIRTNWDIVVEDTNGCQFRIIDKSISLDPSPSVTTPALASNQCFVSSGFTFTAVGASGVTPYVYSINGGASFQASSTFTVNTPGSYTVTIKDANGCTATSPTPTIVYAPLTSIASITKELDCSASPDAIITVTMSGGNGPYTYTVQKGAGVVSAPSAPIVGPTFTYSVALVDVDTYTFEITDANSCTSTTTIGVDPITNPIVTSNKTDVSCNGGFNGTVQLTGSGGSGGYTYSDDNVTFTSTSLFTGLAAGSYTFYIQDSKSCTSNVLVTITEPVLLAGTGALTQGLTCGSGNATQAAEITIAVTPGTGTAPYTYSFDGGVNYTTSDNYFTYTSETVSAFIKDAHGCFAGPIDITVPALNPPTDLDFISPAVTCIAPTTDVTLTTTNGVGTLSYAILSPASEVGNTTGLSTGTFTGLAPDTYMFEVTDANGCTYQESYTVVPVTNITIAGLKLNDVYCFGDNTGAIQFTVSDYVGTYTATLTSGTGTLTQTGNTIDLTGLVVGSYTVEVTDDITGCPATETVIVSEPLSPLTFTATAANVYCTNDESQITVTPSGGTATYTYAAVLSGNPAPALGAYGNNNVVTVDTNSGLDLVWDVYVQDANGCVTSNPITVVLDPMPTVVVPAMAANQCSVSSGFTFTAIGSSGVIPYTYSIGTGFQSSDTFTVSTPGTYYVTIKDANGCEAISPTPVTVYPAIDLIYSITTLPSCAEGDGVISITGSGGSGIYNYSINPSASITQTGNVFSGLSSAVNYVVTIEDATTSCTKDISVMLSTATPVAFTSTSTPVSCNGGNDGGITINLPMSNDNPIYTYEITAPITVAAQTSNSFSGLAAGTYTVLVTSGRGCTLSQDVTVNEPNPIVVSAPIVVDYACSTGTNTTNFATITVNTVTGGSGTYANYEFIKNGNVVQFSNNNLYTESDLTGGNYTINVYDDNGCIGTTTVNIAPYIQLDKINISIDNAITCTNDEDITVSVSTSGGTPTNLEFNVDIIGSTSVYSQTNVTGVFTGLPIGNYIITVANLDTGCSLQRVHYISEPNTFDLTIDSVIDVTCFSASDGSVNVTFIDRVPTPIDNAGLFSYTVSDALGNLVTSGSTANAGPVSITNLVSGTYTISATLTNSPYCSISKNFTITAPTAALAVSETHTEITCVSGNNNGTISATATGGWPGGYEYQLELTSGSIITPFSDVYNFNGLTAGEYLVSVRDSRGCVNSEIVNLAIPAAIGATVTPSTTLLTC